MPAATQYRFNFVGPGETLGVSINGWALNELVVYSARPHGLFPPGDVDLTQTRVQVLPDGTYGRTAWVKNNSGVSGVCDLDAFWETLT